MQEEKEEKEGTRGGGRGICGGRKGRENRRSWEVEGEKRNFLCFTLYDLRRWRKRMGGKQR